MMYESGSMDCSVLNNYHYEKKSHFIAFLDGLSMPCRKILGGRNACFNENAAEMVDGKTSKIAKVALFVFSVVIFPVGIVSGISLAAKMATSWKDEATCASYDKFPKE